MYQRLRAGSCHRISRCDRLEIRSDLFNDAYSGKKRAELRQPGTRPPHRRCVRSLPWRSNVRPFGTCSLRGAGQPDRAGQRICAVPPPAGSAGAGIRRSAASPTVRPIPAWSVTPAGSETPRGRRARHQCPGAGDHLWFGQFVAIGFARGGAALCRRVTTDHRPAPGQVTTDTDPPAWPGRDQQVHRDLPGLLGAGRQAWRRSRRLASSRSGRLEIGRLPTGG